MTENGVTSSNISLGHHETDEALLRKLWIATKITNHPIGVWCIGFILMIILTILDAFVLELAGTEQRAFFVESDEYVEMVDAWDLASEKVASSNEDTNALPQTEEQSLFTVQMMFKLQSYKKKIDESNANKTDYWILTPENLITINKYESKVIDDSEWNTYYCYVSNTTTYECDYFSIARYLSETFNWNYSSMTTELIKEAVLELYESSSSNAALVEASFNAEYVSTEQTYIYRSFLNGGLPIPSDAGIYNNGTIIKTSKYSNADDDYDAQEDEYNKWADEIWIDITVDNNANLKDGNLKIVTLVYSVYIDYFNVILLEGMNYIIFSIIFVLLWMTVHLQSFFLSVMAILQIMLAFPFAYFIYYYILQVTHFDNLSLLIIFVLLGVGADDVFVFTDAWQQSLHFVPEKKNLEQRMTFAYRRASKAMLVTQITTFFAFLATAFALIMPISAFGIWAATIIACNYILVITMYPAILLVHHHWILPLEKKYCCRCIHKPKGDNTKISKKGIGTTKVELAESIKQNTNNDNNNSNNDIDLKETQIKSNELDDEDDDEGPPPGLERAKSVEEQAEEYRSLERFFGLTWVYYVTKFKIPILIFFTILFGLASWQATGIEAQDEDEEWFNDDHYMSKATSFAEEFSASESDGLVDINIAWGIKGIDRDGTSIWDVDDFGKVVWDDSFDMSTPEQQQFLKDTCYNLSLSDLVYSQDEVICPMDYIELYANSINETIPWTYMDTNDINYNADTQKEEFAIFLQNFTNSIYAYTVTSNNLLYVDNSDDIPEVKFIGVYLYASIGWDATATLSRKARDEWTDYLEDTFDNNEDCPTGVCKPIQAALRWAWLRTMQEFVRSAVQGILIAMPLAFCVLLASTRNWIVSIYATIDILGIMVCELAVMALQGWKFGVSESVSIVIIIGFSVDYVVHFANAYLESTSNLRGERLSFSLLTMGISVASGAITTLLAGFMLIFPEVVFFQKMGVLIISTIFFSVFWALLFFVALLSLCGPQYKQGNIPFEKLFKICKKDNKNNNDNDTDDNDNNDGDNDITTE